MKPTFSWEGGNLVVRVWVPAPPIESIVLHVAIGPGSGPCECGHEAESHHEREHACLTFWCACEKYSPKKWTSAA